MRLAVRLSQFGQFIRLSDPKPVTLAQRRAKLAERAIKEASLVRTETRLKKLSLVEARRKEYEQRVQALAVELAQFNGDEADSPHGYETPRVAALPAINSASGSASHRSAASGGGTHRSSSNPSQGVSLHMALLTLGHSPGLIARYPWRF